MSENNSSYPNYVGRYAPSPTGRLHFGNLRTALLGWLHARLQQGTWLLRFDDLDTPRVKAGSDEQIMADLNWLGLHWDGEPYYQSDHLERYQFILDSLVIQQHCYECYCSRKDIQQAVSAPHGKMAVYPGTCRQLTPAERASKAQHKSAAMRLRVNPADIHFVDGIVGAQQQSLATECGDFVIKRADGLFAYQLSVVIDDIDQGVTDVVRGVDLLDSSARQIYLFQLLQNQPPSYWHMPLVCDEQGQRMAKRDGSASLLEWQQAQRSAEELIAYFAASVGLLPAQYANTAMSAVELLDCLTLDQFQQCLAQAS